jgi:RNA polymerase sigma-70 factor (ECF subfamily)
MEPNDREIIARVQRGDRNAYVILFERYYGRVERFARSRLNNSETARDIASETFLRAYRNVDRFRLEEEITYLGYLLMICHRLIRTEHSRQPAVAVKSLDDEDDEIDRIVDDGPSPMSALLDAEQIGKVREALADLPEDDREIIFLAYERDLSRRDIMHIMNKPSISAVTSHLYRAMQRLKTKIVRHDYFASMHRPAERDRDE